MRVAAESAESAAAAARRREAAATARRREAAAERGVAGSAAAATVGRARSSVTRHEPVDRRGLAQEDILSCGACTRRATRGEMPRGRARCPRARCFEASAGGSELPLTARGGALASRVERWGEHHCTCHRFPLGVVSAGHYEH